MTDEALIEIQMDQQWMLVMTWYSMRLQKKSLRPQPNEMLPFSRLGLRRRF